MTRDALAPDDHAVLVHALDMSTRADVDAHRGEPRVRLPRQLLAEAGEDARTVVDQDDTCGAWIDATEVRAQGEPGHLRDRAGQLHPRRARSHEDEGEEVGMLRGVLFRLRDLVGSQHLGPNRLSVLE